MAGSAGSPPRRLAVKLCGVCWRPMDGATACLGGIYDRHDPSGYRVVEAMTVEQAERERAELATAVGRQNREIREQSDALLTALTTIAQRMPHGTATDENWCAVVEMAEEANEALDSYLKATAGEDGHGR